MSLIQVKPVLLKEMMLEQRRAAQRRAASVRVASRSTFRDDERGTPDDRDFVEVKSATRGLDEC